MKWFNRKHEHLIGIDITATDVKLLELSKAGTGYKVESYAIAPLAEDAVVDNTTNLELVAKAIKVAVKQSGTSVKHACVAIDGAAVMTKVITLSAELSKEEMEESAIFETEQYIPYSLDEVYMDFEVQHINEENPKMLNVLLAVSQREHVNERIEVLKMAGLTASIMDVGTFAMENSYTLLKDQLPNSDKEQTVAIADIGETTTTLIILQKNHVIYTREQSFGGKQLTKEIQQRYGLSYEEARLAKRQGGLPDNYNSDILNPFKQALVQRVVRPLQFFILSSDGGGIDALILAGDAASIEGVDSLTEKELGVPVFVANPFINMPFSNKIKPQSLNHDAAAMMTACGLALRSFD